MALKIVTGGTTGAADGTLVSSGNPLVIVALNTAIDAHIRCDDGYWSNDQSFDVPAELQVSFDGGSTWYGNADEPITAPEIYAVNVPIKIRQTTAAAWASGSFLTNGTYTAIAALANVGSFTAAATSGSHTSIDLSWAAVTNRGSYKIDRATNSGFTTGVTLDLSPGLTTTSFVDTGLTAGVTYYYRIKAISNSGRYTDSASYATANATATAWTSPITVSIATGTDDAWRRLTPSFYSVQQEGGAGGGIGAGRYDGTNRKYGCAMRFANVQVPPGATITAATFSGKVYGSDPGTACNTRIRAQKVSGNNPGTFDTSAANFDARFLTAGAIDSSKVTTAVVAWDSIPVWTADASKTSPEIKTVIQEIIDYSGWAAGNAIVILWDDFDDRSTGTDSLRFLYDKDTAGGYQPTLSISFTT